MRLDKGIDEQLFATFNLMEQYSSAAYCSNNYNSSGDKVICSAGNCDMVQAADTITLVEFARYVPLHFSTRPVTSRCWRICCPHLRAHFYIGERSGKNFHTPN
jgi:hypothetical protein